MHVADLTVCEIQDAVARRTLSASEVCRAFIERVERLNGPLNAFNTVTAEQALARAADLDRGSQAPADAPLLGVPLAIKDNICTKGTRTTASSQMLEQFIPPYDATTIQRLERAGALVIGKTNCDEFAMGSSNEYSAFGPARNPWDPDRIPGGSSGGSAVAVAARMAPAALGSDTGGSIRFPACMCGIVGLKPTYGRVSRYGLIAFASSLDQIGPLGRTARDCARILQSIAGHDPADATSATEPLPDLERGLTGDLRDLRIGVPRAILATGVHPDVLERFDAAMDVLRGRGVQVVDIELPHARHAIPAYYMIATAEASSNLARYDGVRYGFRAPLERDSASLVAMYEQTRDLGFGDEVKRRIMLGTYVLSAGYYEAYYLKAQQARTLIRQDYERAFEHVDAVAMPTSPTPPFRIGEKSGSPLQMYLVDIFTVGVNLAGLPSLSVPCGFTAPRLPTGLQLTGRLFDEATILRLADGYERDVSWSREAPPV